MTSESQGQTLVVPAGFFVLRTPLLPFDAILQWSAGLQACDALGDDCQLSDAVRADRIRLRDRLQHVFRDPVIKEALFVASPDLDARIDFWRQKPDSKAGERVELSLARYFLRMAGRATPYGLCAGCSVGTVSTRTNLEVGPREGNRRHVRLDINYLSGVADRLSRDHAFRAGFTYRSNSSLYRIAGKIRYVASRIDENGHQEYSLITADETEYLNTVLNRARDGASLAALTGSLVGDEVSPAEAEDFVLALIDNQLLISDFQPTIVGTSPIVPLIEQLRRCVGADNVTAQLEKAHRALEALAKEPLGVPGSRYVEVADSLRGLPREFDLGRLFRVDLFKDAPAATVSAAVLEELASGIHVLHRFSNAPVETAFTRFLKAFAARYADREVPLTTALDEELGIGFDSVNETAAYGTALLDGLTISKSAPPESKWTKRDQFLFEKLSIALEASADEVEVHLDEADRAGLPVPPPLPRSFSAGATIASCSDGGSLKDCEFRVVLQYAAGPSGVQLLGRFCEGDPKLRDVVEQYIQAEESMRPDAVFAEIVHLPEGRAGNVVARPAFRRFEIPYLGRSEYSRQRIPVDDLLISVVGRRLVLRSRTLGREVIPRLTNAHAYFHKRNPGIYRFLCALQHQGVAGDLSWNWGALSEAPFLPRVRSGKAILSRARWRLTSESLAMLLTGDATDRFRAVQQYRTSHHLPRFVLLADGDKRLPVDLNNVVNVEAFLQLVKQRSEATLMEMYPDPNHLAAHGPDGRYVHEVIVPFFSTTAAEQSNPAGSGAGDPGVDVAREFLPGSEWLFAKLYTGPVSADRLLQEVLAPMIADATRSNAVDRWFFIRYADPDPHLRVRFHGIGERLLAEVVPRLKGALAPWIADGGLRSLQLHTYEREIERYGGAAAIEVAERIFYEDSAAVLTIVDMLVGDTTADARWKLALLGTEMLLTDFGFDLSEKLHLMQGLRRRFGTEFEADSTPLRHQLGEKYRGKRAGLEALLRGDCCGDPTLAAGLRALRERSQRLQPQISSLHELARQGRLTKPIGAIVESFAHMHVNRVLCSAHRAHELVIYDFLARLYRSAAARKHNTYDAESLIRSETIQRF